jgi:hypothetical protein
VLRSAARTYEPPFLELKRPFHGTDYGAELAFSRLGVLLARSVLPDFNNQQPHNSPTLGTAPLSRPFPVGECMYGHILSPDCRGLTPSAAG